MKKEFHCNVATMKLMNASKLYLSSRPSISWLLPRWSSSHIKTASSFLIFADNRDVYYEMHTERISLCRDAGRSADYWEKKVTLKYFEFIKSSCVAMCQYYFCSCFSSQTVTNCIIDTVQPLKFLKISWFDGLKTCTKNKYILKNLVAILKTLLYLPKLVKLYLLAAFPGILRLTHPREV